MYSRPAPRQTKRVAEPTAWDAPTSGLIANRSLATPDDLLTHKALPGAMVLENWFPSSRVVTLRRGSQLYATVDPVDVEEMLTYHVGNVEELFAATEDTIFDITLPLTPVEVMTGLHGGDWVFVQFATTGGNFLVAVNGADPMMLYDGDFWYPVRESENYSLAYDGGTGSFTVGQTVTGATSLATGAIVSKHGTTAIGTLLLSDVDGTFQDNEALTDPLGGAATTNGTRKLHSNLSTLAYDTGTAAFAIGETVTGATSGATGIIRNLSGTTVAGTLVLDSVIGTFVDDEPLSTPGGGAALADGAATLKFAGVTGLGEAGIATADWNYVWVHQNRLWFAQAASVDSWYLNVDAIGGEATVFPLGGVFARGGELLFGSAWSIESADGLANRCVFVSSGGDDGAEVAVYEGVDPSTVDTWAQIGIYRIGRPMGKKAHVRAGGDLVIATDLGFLPLSAAIERDYAALAPAAYSYAIEDEWAREVRRRSSAPWKVITWPSGRMTVIMLPPIPSEPDRWFVINVRTAAWCTFTGYHAHSVRVFNSRCFYGGHDGKVVEIGVTGLDQGLPYTGTVVSLFDDLGVPAALKVPTVARAVFRARNPIVFALSILYDYIVKIPAAPLGSSVPATATWGGGVKWGDGTEWGSGIMQVVTQRWVSVAGSGQALAPVLRVTAGTTLPLDVELVRIDMLHEAADLVS